MRDYIRKIIFIASSITLLVLCSGCSILWKPGHTLSRNYEQTANDRWKDKSTSYLVKKFKKVSCWPRYKFAVSGRFHKYKIDYYSIHRILKQRINQTDVFEMYKSLAVRTIYETVARDAVRTMSLVLKTRDEIRDEFVELYKDEDTSHYAKKEILHILMEKRVVVPELIMYIKDYPGFKEGTLSVEELYINFIQSGQ